MKDKKLKIRLTTVLWGSKFVNFYLNYILKSLMSRGNLPDVAKRHLIEYSIYTRKRDIRLIKRSRIYNRINSLIKVNFYEIETSRVDGNRADIQWHYLNIAYRQAKKNNEILFIIVPDVVYSEGTLLRWAKFFEKGYKCVFTAGMQVVLETIKPVIESRFAKKNSIDIKRNELHKLCISHLHPGMICYHNIVNHGVAHPQFMISQLSNTGMEITAFTNHPMCIDPNNFSVAENFKPLNNLDDCFFDNLTMLSIEPLLKDISWFRRIDEMDESKTLSLGGWLDHFTREISFVEARKAKYNLFFNDEKSIVRNSNDYKYINKIQKTLLIYRIWKNLVNSNQLQNARMFALAHYQGYLYRQIPDNELIALYSSTNLDINRLSNLEESGIKNTLTNMLLVHMSRIFKNPRSKRKIGHRRLLYLQISTALIIMQKVLEKYKGKVVPKNYELPTLELVNNLLENYKLFKDSFLKIQEFVKDNPNSAEAWLELGINYYLRKKYPKALESFQRCLDTDKSNDKVCCEAADWCSRIYEILGKPKKAVEYYKIALGFDKYHTFLHVRLAKLLVKLGNYKEAMDHFHEGMEYDFTSAPVAGDPMKFERDISINEFS